MSDQRAPVSTVTACVARSDSVTRIFEICLEVELHARRISRSPRAGAVLEDDVRDLGTIGVLDVEVDGELRSDLVGFAGQVPSLDREDHVRV
ncbi:hypothetical protein [Curtobacterium sp. CFBP9011]|uniref:hypothetical protein n=1 Tax=Curtobacterium sp. CFBP9011 TaxID=3096530 RepID=UPI002A6B4AFF|nr:hypothetical protein [Curtobacterium sp. CFBP9011]MDY1006566.1 hypothetical protein [Curtobacterium sp. CFBP9011]